MKQIEDVLQEEGIDVKLEVPPKKDMGDFAFPCFTLAKEYKKAPPMIATELAEKLRVRLTEKGEKGITVKSLGPYVNFFIDSSLLVQDILSIKAGYGHTTKDTSKVLIESPAPNTNKPLHLGHLRNMLLAQSLGKILRTQGKDVHMINMVNDRGVHICKSMLAYEKFGKGKTPESEDRKSDHFVGDYYVEFAKAVKEHPELEEEAQEMLVKWEAEDENVRALWQKMNDWVLSGFNETYAALNFEIEKTYYESETYIHGKEIILEGFEKGIFEKDDKEAVIVNLEDQKLGTKVLLRGNGTSVYITQDIYLAKTRYDEFNFDEMVYVVGNEQEYHFKVLFEVFKKLGWTFADKCYHFSYGMVELPDGKMKSREGNVIDTDNLLSEMTALSKEEVISRYKDIDEKEADHRAHVIAHAAIRFFILKFDPLRNFVFNPKESLAFEGETGPYVLYVYARIASIFRKHGQEVSIESVDSSVLDTERDKQLMKCLGDYPEVLAEAAKQMKPSLICHYLIDLASEFNSYYRDNPILKAEDTVRDARLALISKVQIVIKDAMSMLGVEVLEQM